VLQLQTTTGTGNVPTICGWNTGQHSKKEFFFSVFHLREFNKKIKLKHIKTLQKSTVYVDMGNQGGDTTNLAFTFTTTTTTRNWEIKVTQVECSNPGRYTFISVNILFSFS